MAERERQLAAALFSFMTGKDSLNRRNRRKRSSGFSKHSNKECNITTAIKQKDRCKVQFLFTNDIVELAMNYENESQMVTRQGGSLKGTINIPTTGHTQGYQQWLSNLTIQKPVSRPWVQLKDWIPAPTTVTESTLEASSHSESVVPIQDDFIFW